MGGFTPFGRVIETSRRRHRHIFDFGIARRDLVERQDTAGLLALLHEVEVAASPEHTAEPGDSTDLELDADAEDRASTDVHEHRDTLDRMISAARRSRASW